MKLKLSVNPRKCTGCGQCVSVCSAVKTGQFWPHMARLMVQTDSRMGVSTPIVCLHCEDAWCQNACKFEAITRNTTTGAITIDSEACTGCKMCMAACPYDVMGFDDSEKLAIKCDLCDGKPRCVEACYPKAITAIAFRELSHPEPASQAKE
jgi:anaerobic carbon-monoxide dehydrogenase iron sulfur subunit